MSHFTTLTTQLTDVQALRAALGDVGYGTVEVHEQPQPLFGFQGDRRADTAHVIVRREFVGRMSNDLGFRQGSDGHIVAVISDFDRSKHNAAWLGRVTARHAYHVAATTLAEQGFDLTSETTERDGTVRMVLRRFR